VTPWTHWVVLRRRELPREPKARGNSWSFEALCSLPRAAGPPGYVWRPYVAGVLPPDVALSTDTTGAAQLMAEHGGTSCIPLNMIEGKINVS
jgi:hypothetical protein